MAPKKLLSLVLIALILLPTPGWGQFLGPQTSKEAPDQGGPGEAPSSLEDQAQFYLQRISPLGPPSAGQLPPAPPPPPPTLPMVPMPPAAPRLPEEISAVEKRAADFGMDVKQFGYSFFSQPPDTFLPAQQVPVGADYVIGPGDSIRIMIWGSVEGDYTLPVDRNGQVSIPKVGVIQVSGLTYRQLREVMDREFARQ